MSAYRVGDLRPSQILFTYGIGAIADLPNLSALVMGLEDWDKSRGRELREARLLAAVQTDLGPQVQQLRSPPQPPEDDALSAEEAEKVGIPVAPFPTWLVCSHPKCRLLAPLRSDLFSLANTYHPHKARYVHTHCQHTRKHPPPAIPARFLVACQHGHLDDFPWVYFVHRGEPCAKHGPLRLLEFGVSGAVTDIVVKCDGCGKSRRLVDAFGNSGRQTMPRCRGRHPHLQTFEDCDEQMQTMLLGASNSWFAVLRSALSLPASGAELAQRVQKHWPMLKEMTDLASLQVFLKAMEAVGQLQDLQPYPPQAIWATLEQQRQPSSSDIPPTDLKTPEWRVLVAANLPPEQQAELQLRAVEPPQGYEDLFAQTILVERLREVRALIGFTRIESVSDLADAPVNDTRSLVALSRQPPTWIPATEVKGEGIFLQFNEAALQAWENQAAQRRHAGIASNAYKDWLARRRLNPDDRPAPPMRYWLLHSFAHALMRQLAIACGYNAAGLRERIYSRRPDDPQGPQAGVLIYTAAADSEGTLGGLVHLGEPATLGHYLTQALEAMHLCASDPLCAEHEPKDDALALHWAACHACLFSPETSCEAGNKFLDRALLVPTLAEAERCFFASSEPGNPPKSSLGRET